MKRFVLCICLGGLVAALWAPTVFGFAANFDYTGHVKGNPSASVGFFVKHTAAGHRKVTGFTVTQIPYTCRDAADGVTAGWRFEPKMRVKSDRTFFGTGQWTSLPLDPSGLVKGQLRRGGVAVGSFKLNGELAGADTHCHTSLLRFRATKQQ
jgi:hypothetical protein